ncbi:MAG TPA: hypothetical protein VEG31_01015 [Thermoproteota archaeon]|nr:hypothetical protein [Thermoproteota archaeon]
MVEGMRVERGKTAEADTVEGDLTLGAGSKIGPKSQGKVVVKGITACEGDCEVLSGMETEGIRGERKGRVSIHGDLLVQGSIELDEGELIVDGLVNARDIDVGRKLSIAKDLHCASVDVGGSLDVGGDAETESVGVGGSVSVQGRLKARKLDVGGSVKIKGLVDLDELDVGGVATVGGGRVDSVSVGGTFESFGKLSFKKLDVGGIAKIAAGEGQGKIDVGGIFNVQGSLEFDVLNVGGKVDIRGFVKGRHVEVGGQMDAGENATIEERLRVGGYAKVGGELNVGNVEVGGSLAAKVCLAEGVAVGGEIRTEKGTKAKRFEIGRGGEVKGPIVADEVKIGRGAEVEDVYAGKLEMEADSSANNVYAHEARLGPDSRVSGELLYTGTLELGEEAKVRSGPTKAEKLPSPPI